jgi:hypothetical protein
MIVHLTAMRNTSSIPASAKSHAIHFSSSERGMDSVMGCHERRQRSKNTQGKNMREKNVCQGSGLKIGEKM